MPAVVASRQSPVETLTSRPVKIWQIQPWRCVLTWRGLEAEVLRCSWAVLHSLRLPRTPVPYTRASVNHNVNVCFTTSGVTRVGVTRGGNWRCHPYFSWKKTDDLFSAARWCHFLAVRPRLSTVLSKFSHIFYFIRVSPPWRVSPWAVRPPRPPNNATVYYISF